MQSAPQSTGVKGGLALSDGLTNVVTSLGTSRDKNAYNRYSLGACVLTQHEIEAAYSTSWLVRKVHDLPPFDMTRAGRDWQAEADQIEKLEAVETKTALWFKLQRALILARTWGGGALILGVNQGRPDQELRPESLGADTLQFIHVVSRYQLTYRDLNMDPMSPFFGEPVMWQMSSGNGGQIDIHPSRVIAFVGQRRLEGGVLAMGQDRFWGDPLLLSIRDATVNADLSQASIAALLQEAKIDTLKIPDLSSKVGTAIDEQRFMRRVELANLVKSTMNTRIIDATEDWSTFQANFTALPDVARVFLMVAAGAADIPATRLLSQSPTGMNATGESDTENYLMMLEARQTTDVRPQLERLDAILIPSALGSRPKEVHWSFAPLRTPKPKEAAEIEKLEAETVAIYASEKIMPPDALAKAAQNRLVESGRWPGLEQAIEETEHELDFEPVVEPDAPANEDDPSALTQGPAALRKAANDAATAAAVAYAAAMADAMGGKPADS